jgi:uncharacterized protein YceK
MNEPMVHAGAIRFAAGIVLIAMSSGCGTFITHSFDAPHQAYTGVRADAQAIGTGSPGFIIDLPFSAAADTILLPVDLWPQTQDPLKKGWTFVPLPKSQSVQLGQATNQLDQKIVQDYQKFIAEKHLYQISGVSGFYEDGKGHLAIKFEAYEDHDTRSYVLIYDERNRRTKVVIFGHHRSMC